MTAAKASVQFFVAVDAERIKDLDEVERANFLADSIERVAMDLLAATSKSPGLADNDERAVVATAFTIAVATVMHRMSMSAREASLFGPMFEKHFSDMSALYPDGAEQPAPTAASTETVQ